MKQIAVIGPIPRDHIVTHQGDLIQKWGCVTHPVIALSVLAGEKIEIIPVCHVRSVDLDNVKEVFRGYDGINLKHMTSKNDQGDIISLKFVDMNNRIERQTGFMDPILPADMKNLLNCKVIRPNVVETTALGAAYLAGLTVGYWKSREEIQQLWQAEKEFVPAVTPEIGKGIKGWKRAVKAAQAWSGEKNQE